MGFVFERFAEKYSGMVLSLAAGVMLSTSVYNLIYTSVNDFGEYNALVSVIGVFCGALSVGLLDLSVKKMMIIYDSKKGDILKNNKQLHRILLFVAAVALHNFPEGLAAGVGFGTGNISDALTVAGSIAIQNLPEGMVIISPMLSVGIGKNKTFLIAVLTGFSEIIGTLLGFFAVSFSNKILPFALSFAGGTMLQVICSDMIPETQNGYHNKCGSYLLIIGFCIMLLADILIN